MKPPMKFVPGRCAACFAVITLLSLLAVAQGAEVPQWTLFETSFESAKVYSNAFAEVEVDVVFQQGDKQWKVPAFWAGDKKWTVRFAPPAQGKYTYHVEMNMQAWILWQNARSTALPLFQGVTSRREAMR